MGSASASRRQRIAGGFLAAWGGLTVVDVVVVHWVLRRHRLYRGDHVTAVEAAVAGLGALALVRGAASLRRGPASLDRSERRSVIGRRSGTRR